jgi:5-methylcytosine-specific restriction endonuclease McrA
LRRAVLTRDQRRCRVPGCTHATFVDVHHIVPRSEGGPNQPTNLVTLCGGHHRALTLCGTIQRYRIALVVDPGPDGPLPF